MPRTSNGTEYVETRWIFHFAIPSRNSNCLAKPNASLLLPANCMTTCVPSNKSSSFLVSPVETIMRGIMSFSSRIRSSRSASAFSPAWAACAWAIAISLLASAVSLLRDSASTTKDAIFRSASCLSFAACDFSSDLTLLCRTYSRQPRTTTRTLKIGTAKRLIQLAVVMTRRESHHESILLPRHYPLNTNWFPITRTCLSRFKTFAITSYSETAFALTILLTLVKYSRYK